MCIWGWELVCARGAGQYFPEMWACSCVSYLFYGGDSDNKEEGQAAGDWAGGGVDDKLQRGRGGVGGKCKGGGCKVTQHWVRKCSREEEASVRTDLTNSKDPHLISFPPSALTGNILSLRVRSFYFACLLLCFRDGTCAGVESEHKERRTNTAAGFPVKTVLYFTCYW